ncbi:MAG: FAD-dependent oxidoreductase [Pseudomonadota bacterium]
MESLAQNLETMVRTPLTEGHVARMRAIGTEHDYAPGQDVTAFGAEQQNFCYVVDGEVEAFDPVTGERYGEATLGPGQFAGEAGFLSGGRNMISTRAVKPSRILCVPRQAMLDLMSQVPEMSDIIVTVFAARRRALLESNRAGLTLWGSEDDRALRRIAAFAGRNKIPIRRLDPDGPEARDMAQRCGIEEGKPAVIVGKGTVLPELTPRAVAHAFGLDLRFEKGDVYDVLVVGGGPAGIAAGLYAGAEGLKALVIEDLTIGGQAGTSSRIENYMGFPTGISGADLCWRGEVQAMKFGTRFAVPRRAREVLKCKDNLFHVRLDDGDTVSACSLVIATGVQYRKLPIDRLSEFENAGVYYAATDVEARFCRDSEVAVIGGGNSAGQAAMFMARSAKHVHVLVRGRSLAASMSDYLLSRLQQNPRITIHLGTEITELHGDRSLDCVTIQDRFDNRHWELRTSAVFVMAGAAPNTGWLSGLVELDDMGFVKTGAGVGGASVYATSCPGVYAVGDVRAGSVKRVAAGVGEGSVVISRVWDYLDAMHPETDADVAAAS